MFDRCTDDSIEIAQSLGMEYAVNIEGEGRQCSRARNIGASTFPLDDILFLDGDRVPNFNVHDLDKSPYDVTIIKNQTDRRDRYGHSWGVDPFWGSFHNGVFGSALFVRRKAMNKVQLKYGHLFDEDFTKWGEEDRHFGDLLYSVGATCGFADDSMRVSGRTTLEIERRKDFHEMLDMRVKKLFALGLDHLIRDPEI